MSTGFPTANQEARISALERKVELISQDVIGSFRLTTVGQFQTERKLEERFDAVDASIARVEADVVSMKAEVLNAFNQLLQIIDTRLPDSGK